MHIALEAERHQRSLRFNVAGSCRSMKTLLSPWYPSQLAELQEEKDAGTDYGHIRGALFWELSGLGAYQFAHVEACTFWEYQRQGCSYVPCFLLGLKEVSWPGQDAKNSVGGQQVKRQISWIFGPRDRNCVWTDIVPCTLKGCRPPPTTPAQWREPVLSWSQGILGYILWVCTYATMVPVGRTWP